MPTFTANELIKASPTGDRYAVSCPWSEVGQTVAPYLPTVRNRIINGALDVWQRGASFTSIGNGAYFADRFLYGKTGAMVHDVLRSTDVPTPAQAGILYNYSLHLDCTTVDSSIASGDITYIAQHIEGYNFRDIAQAKTFTLSFWVKGTKTGIHCVSFRNSGGDRSYVAEYTINTTATWEYKTITVSTVTPSGGTWDYTNGIGLRVAWTLTAGSSFQTTAGAWQTGNFLATGNQVNACDSTSNDFRITGVQLEAGSFATPFEYRHFQQELAMCQRYCWKMTDSTGGLNLVGDKWATNRFMFQVFLPVTLRTGANYNNGTAGAPTFSAGSPSGNQFAFYSWSDGGYCTITGSLTVQAYSSSPYNSFIMELTASTSFSGTVGATGLIQAGTGTTGYLDAEL